VILTSPALREDPSAHPGLAPHGDAGPMHAIQIVASVENEAAGPSYTVPRLAESLAGAGASVKLFSLGGDAPSFERGVFREQFPQTLAGVPFLSQLRLSSALEAALAREGASTEVIHTHGLWLAPNIYPAAAALAHDALFVLSPRGMLSEAALAFSPLKKRLVWAAAQRKAAQGAGLIHATSAAEAEEIRAAGLRAPITIIPNGVETSPLKPGRHQGPRTVLSLGRIHPKKGLDRLLKAWSRLGPVADEWRLRIVGPSEGGHAADLRTLAASLGLRAVDIEGPLFGEAKAKAYQDADLFVLPTLNENFAMTVAEALAAGTPVIATKGAPWPGLSQQRCGWWVDHGEAPLAAALAEAMTLPAPALAAMGERGHQWMVRDFSWERIGCDMLEAYRWARRGGQMPSTVQT
jgi:glycosyltransferase involved in cell wall biosynthesis